jgi:hypothetical protein
MSCGGDLEGAGPRHDGAVLDGVLHRPQAVSDGVLDLRQAVIRRTLPASQEVKRVKDSCLRCVAGMTVWNREVANTEHEHKAAD